MNTKVQAKTTVLRPGSYVLVIDGEEAIVQVENIGSLKFAIKLHRQSIGALLDILPLLATKASEFKHVLCAAIVPIDVAYNDGEDDGFDISGKVVHFERIGDELYLSVSGIAWTMRVNTTTFLDKIMEAMEVLLGGPVKVNDPVLAYATLPIRVITVKCALWAKPALVYDSTKGTASISHYTCIGGGDELRYSRQKSATIRYYSRDVDGIWSGGIPSSISSLTTRADAEEFRHPNI